MDWSQSTKLTLLAFGSLTIVACSNSSNDDVGEVDTRITIQQFVQNKPIDQSASLNEEITENTLQAANRALISLAQDKMDLNVNNVALTLWPIISSLALATAASHGDTADEIALELNEFGLDLSWPLASNALYESLQATGITKIDNDVWSHHGSQFESDFLVQFDSAFRPDYHFVDFSSGEDISDAVDEAANNTFGASYAFGINKYADTRLLTLNQIKTLGLFDVEGLNVEEFNGLFMNYSGGGLIRAPMVRFQGSMDYYENSEFVAHRIPIAGNRLSLISIQTNEESYDYVKNDLEAILSAINNGWRSQDTSTVLPMLSINYQLDANNWLYWKNIGLIYSEELADLRNMDRKGGLYMQGIPYDNRLTITRQGIELASISGQAFTFSEHNIFAPGNNGDTSGSAELTLVVLPPVFCNMAQPDLHYGLIVLIDSISGLIQSILSLNRIEGTSEGAHC